MYVRMRYEGGGTSVEIGSRFETLFEGWVVDVQYFVLRMHTAPSTLPSILRDWLRELSASE